jgi:hypothetical protein
MGARRTIGHEFATPELKSAWLPSAAPGPSLSGRAIWPWAIIQNMAAITDKDRSVFKDAAATVLENFTQQEQLQIAAMASELRTIIAAAKVRDQGKFKKAR